MNLRHHLQFSPHNSLIAGLSLYRMHAILEEGHVTYVPGCMFCNYWFCVIVPRQLSGKEKTIECCMAALLYQLHERLCLFNISPNFHVKQVLRQELEAKPSVRATSACSLPDVLPRRNHLPRMHCKYTSNLVHTDKIYTQKAFCQAFPNSPLQEILIQG